MLFLDTNVFIRHLTSDHPDHSRRALAFFDRILVEEIEATTSEVVIAEMVHVLSSKVYEVARGDIAEAISTLLELPNLKMPHRQVYLEALACYGTSRLDFADCLNVSHMRRQGITEIVSFDHDFDQFPDIIRVEP